MQSVVSVCTVSKISKKNNEDFQSSYHRRGQSQDSYILVDASIETHPTSWVSCKFHDIFDDVSTVNGVLEIALTPYTHSVK